MLKILHKGTQYNLAMDETGFTGDHEVDKALAVVTKMKAGRVAAINTLGVGTLADGTPGNNLHPIGFIINDAEGGFFENIPALASKKVPIHLINGGVVVTDQIDVSDTFDEGDPVYAGTGGDIGNVTNNQASGALPLGIAASSATAALPDLTILVGVPAPTG